MKQRVCGYIVLGATAALGLWSVLPRSYVVAAPLAAGSSYAVLSQDLQWQGVASCASMACHHGNGPKGSKGSEYTTWITNDPHARAFAVLDDQRSKVIEKNLHKLPSLEAAKPEADRLCLSCHAVELDKIKHTDRVSLSDGVGCESCHGPAQKWLTEHYQPGWKQLSLLDKEKQGMWPTKDLHVRAEVCVRCHIGVADSEVNHDLIAAGHPRMNFEYAAYLANLPKHWSERDEKNRYPDFEARAWAIGQVVWPRRPRCFWKLRATSAAKDKAPWPEFAEYDCYACHHGLRDEKWRRDRDFTRRPPGSYPWGTWYTALAPAVAAQWPGSEAKQSVAALQELEKLMSQPYPEPSKVAEKARSAGQALAPWSRTWGQIAVANFCPRPDDRPGPGQGKGHNIGVGWSGATYLALAALQQATRDAQPSARDKQVQDQLRQLVQTLQFAKGYDSPQEYEPSKFDARLKELQKLLPQSNIK